MELGHRRHGRYAAGICLVAELRDLVAVCGIDIDEAVHVADAEALDDRRRRGRGLFAAEDGRR